MGMRYAPLPNGVLIAVRRSPTGIEVIAQEGLSACTVARAVANMLGTEQCEGIYRDLTGTFTHGLHVAHRRAS